MAPAPAPEATDPPELLTVALKVSIHCEGCKKKVKKILQRVEGVGHIDVDSKQNKVTVAGGASAESLIHKLGKYGKQAEIWPETKPSAAVKSCGEHKEEGEGKGSAASTPNLTPPETEKKQQAEEGKLAPPPPPTETTKTVPAAAASGDVSVSKDNSEAPAKSEIKEKKVEIAGDETAAAMNPAYPPPAYTVSYSAVRPTISYSQYAPSPAFPSSYTAYSGHPPLAPSMPSSYTAYSGYEPGQGYPPANYSTDSYYGSVEAPPAAAAGGSYDMFNDENPNACNLM